MNEGDIIVAKADPITCESVSPVTIYIRARIPDFDTLGECEAFYMEQAQWIVEALLNTLPQGTAHQMASLFIQEYFSLYRGQTAGGMIQRKGSITGAKVKGD